MKKSLMLISFAFIFLLTLSVVSAGLWITGDVQRGRTIASQGELATSISKTDGGTTPFSRGSSSTLSARESSAPRGSGCPAGNRWEEVPAKGGGYCCKMKENTRGTGRFFSRK